MKNYTCPICESEDLYQQPRTETLTCVECEFTSDEEDFENVEQESNTYF